MKNLLTLYPIHKLKVNLQNFFLIRDSAHKSNVCYIVYTLQSSKDSNAQCIRICFVNSKFLQNVLFEVVIKSKKINGVLFQY